MYTSIYLHRIPQTSLISGNTFNKLSLIIFCDEIFKRLSSNHIFNKNLTMSQVASQPPPVDLELKKALAELKLKMIDTNQKIKFSDAQIEGLKRSVRHKTITDTEIAKLQSDTKVYQGVGRCFFASTIPEVREGIGKSVADLNDKIQVFETNKEHLERDLKSSENAVRELVIQRKNT